MSQLFAKWTSMLSEASSNFLGLLAIAAVVCIIVIVLMALFASDDVKRANAIKHLVQVLVFCGVAACAVFLVDWAMA